MINGMHMEIKMLLAATASTPSGSNSLTLFAPILIFAAIYFFFLRPRAQKAKQAQLQAKDVVVGDRVMTTSGLFGRVSRVTDETVILEVAPDVELSFIKRAIARKIDEPITTVTDTNEDHDESESIVDLGQNNHVIEGNTLSSEISKELPEDPEAPTPRA